MWYRIDSTETIIHGFTYLVKADTLEDAERIVLQVPEYELLLCISDDPHETVRREIDQADEASVEDITETLANTDLSTMTAIERSLRESLDLGFNGPSPVSPDHAHRLKPIDEKEKNIN